MSNEEQYLQSKMIGALSALMLFKLKQCRDAFSGELKTYALDPRFIAMSSTDALNTMAEVFQAFDVEGLFHAE